MSAFSVNGPKEMSYLSTAAQDAVIGSLLKSGRSAEPVSQVIEPDRLQASQVRKTGAAVLLTGRINVVGDTYRVLLKWMRPDGTGGQEYLEVASLNQLLPQLEGFARVRMEPFTVAAAPSPVPPPPAPAIEPPPPDKKISQQEKSAPVAEPIAPAPPAVVKVEKPPEVPASTKKEEKELKKETTQAEKKAELSREALARRIQEAEAHGFSLISQRLPYEVRALAHGDADGDGQPEVLLTGQSSLYAYRLQGDGQLQEIARYSGKKLDNFVKVGILPAAPGGKPLVVLTNLRGDQAASAILTLQGGTLAPQQQDIPYQLRVVSQGSQTMLLGEAYHAKGSSKHQVFRMDIVGGKVKLGEKVHLPQDAELFSFEWVPAESGEGWALAVLSPSGKLKFYKLQGDKYKRVWTSRESYGGSANDVAVEVQDMFNEVVADYYVVPIGFQALKDHSAPELVLAKNDMLLKEIIGRKPLATDGKIVRLKWDQLGFSETWVSKKVDGSILDYLVTPAPPAVAVEEPAETKGRRAKKTDLPHPTAKETVSTETPPAGKQLLVAVRVRDQGFWEGVGRKDSVLLVYDLN